MLRHWISSRKMFRESLNPEGKNARKEANDNRATHQHDDKGDPVGPFRGRNHQPKGS